MAESGEMASPVYLEKWLLKWCFINSFCCISACAHVQMLLSSLLLGDFAVAQAVSSIATNVSIVWSVCHLCVVCMSSVTFVQPA